MVGVLFGYIIIGVPVSEPESDPAALGKAVGPAVGMLLEDFVGIPTRYLD